MKSTLLNMTAVLFGITLVASAGVGFVNMITVEPIAAAKEAATLAALNEVLPAFDATTTEELTIDDMPITVYTATAGGSVSGYAVQSMTKQGFDGVGIGLGFTLALTVIGAVREILGSGAIFGVNLGFADVAPLIFVLAPGAFLVLGYLMVLFNKLAKK